MTIECSAACCAPDDVVEERRVDLPRELDDREAGHFMPPAPTRRYGPMPEGELALQAEDVVVDRRGYICISDKNQGLWILRYTGPRPRPRPGSPHGRSTRPRSPGRPRRGSPGRVRSPAVNGCTFRRGQPARRPHPTILLVSAVASFITAAMSRRQVQPTGWNHRPVPKAGDLRAVRRQGVDQWRGSGPGPPLHNRRRHAAGRMIGRQGGVSWSEPDRKDRGATRTAGRVSGHRVRLVTPVPSPAPPSRPEGLDHPDPLIDLAEGLARSEHARGRD